MVKFYNTLTRREEAFAPLDKHHVKIYACGPTVYDRAHIGNARSAVVYDVLFRLLSHVYPQVSYVRNITDVDDKINAAAKANGETISTLTQRVTGWFHEDMGALNVLRPTVEPRATEHIGEMITMIQTLIDKGHAYEAEGHVLFAVATDPNYGCLSHRNRDEMIAGARVEVAPYKKDPADFVLWKPAPVGDDASSIFDSPWSKGRPGWHIECSAMAGKHLGETFDIHGGGADLMFPHHENEIAQSTCATGKEFAKVWVHNGFLTVNGEKMSKSLGNFITVHDLLARNVRGESIRWALLSTHYRKPLDWTDKLLSDADKTLDGFYRKIEDVEEMITPPAAFIEALSDDLNVPKALAMLHQTDSAEELMGMGRMLGLFHQSTDSWFKGAATNDGEIGTLIAERILAKKNKDFATSDRIRQQLKDMGVLLEDRPDGTTDWRRA